MTNIGRPSFKNLGLRDQHFTMNAVHIYNSRYSSAIYETINGLSNISSFTTSSVALLLLLLKDLRLMSKVKNVKFLFAIN